MRANIKILAVQTVILAVLAISTVDLVAYFPFPSPLIQPLLPPKLRWPTAEVMNWVEIGQFDQSFARYFARDPERSIPPGDNIVSPADGVVQHIDYRDESTYLVVGLSFWDVHVVRSPLAGTIKDVEPAGVWYDRGPPYSRTSQQAEEMLFLKGKAAPVQQIVTIATRLGDIRVRLITSYWASRLRVWVHPGQLITKGQRIGRIVLGSTVVVEFPGRRAFAVKPPQHVLGGSSIVGSISQ